MTRRPRADMSEDPPVDEAVAAVLAKMEAPLNLRRIIWVWHHDYRWPVPKIATRLFEALREHGLTADQIDGLGVSHDSIRLMVKGPRP